MRGERVGKWGGPWIEWQAGRTRKGRGNRPAPCNRTVGLHVFLLILPEAQVPSLFSASSADSPSSASPSFFLLFFVEKKEEKRTKTGREQKRIHAFPPPSHSPVLPSLIPIRKLQSPHSALPHYGSLASSLLTASTRQTGRVHGFHQYGEGPRCGDRGAWRSSWSRP